MNGKADLCFSGVSEERVWPLRLVHLCVLLGPVHGAKSLHVLLDVLLGLVLHVLVTLEVLGIGASFQLLIHDSVS